MPEPSTTAAATSTTSATTAPPPPQNQKVSPAAPSTVTATGDVSAPSAATIKPSTDATLAAQTQPDGAPESIGPRWFQIQTDSQLGPVNVLLEDAVNDLAANTQAAIERFKAGHGILHTPFEIRVTVLPADYQPTSADLDHHHAIASTPSPSGRGPG